MHVFLKDILKWSFSISFDYLGFLDFDYKYMHETHTHTPKSIPLISKSHDTNGSNTN
jgi:hypothetical protein